MRIDEEGEKAMLIETNLREILKNMLEGNVQITDNSVCGKCSKCGECCSCFLPISRNEADIIQKYVIEHQIRPQKKLLVMENRLTCPYYDGKKCLIYEVRPLICKEFYCYKRPSAELAQKFAKDEYIPVNMWEIANKIDRYFRRRK